MLTAAAMPFAAAADSARAVATVYTVSLLALVPLAVAAVAAIQLRHASAQGRVLVWRCAVSALLVVFVGRMLPLHWIAWVVPSSLAAPLVALGRMQVAASALRVTHAARTPSNAITAVSALLALYGVGVFSVLLPTVVASIRARRVAREGPPLDAAWRAAAGAAAARLGLTRRVEISSSDSVAVPMTWGLLRPIIVIPSTALDWPAAQR